jgi:hypothetical protein
VKRSTGEQVGPARYAGFIAFFCVNVGGQDDGAVVIRASEAKKPQKDQGKSACAAMAEVAQALANAAIENNGGANAAAVEEFDRLFSQAYIGNDGIGKTLSSAVNFWRDAFSSQPGLGPSFRGQSGFKDIFKEKNNAGETPDGIDQTHHYAGLQTAGINNQNAAYWGSLAGDIGNKPDFLLSIVAFDIGASLRLDPTKLSSIGQIIMEQICNNEKK